MSVGQIPDVRSKCGESRRESLVTREGLRSARRGRVSRGFLEPLERRTLLSAALPIVQSIAINDGSAQRSMVDGVTVTFDQPVALDAGAIGLVGRNGAGSGTIVSWSNPSMDGRSWVASF